MKIISVPSCEPDMNLSGESTNDGKTKGYSESSDRTFRKTASQCFAASATNLVKFTNGSFIGFTTVLVAELYMDNPEIEISLNELTWFGSGCFMAPVGALLMGILAQNLGPRRCLLMSSILYIISWVIFYFAKNSAMLLLAQALSGITSPVTLGPGATYVIEITQPHLRSALMASTNLSIIIGAFTTVLYSNWLHWRTIILINLISPVLGFFAVCMIPESPHWLASKGKFDEAGKALLWLRGWTTPENTSYEFRSLKETYKMPDRNSQNHPKKSYKNMFEPYFLRSFYLPFASVSCMFILHACTGYSAIFAYSMIIFKTIDAPIDNHVATSLFDGMRIVGAVVCILTVHYTGKRKLIFISLIGAGSLYFTIAMLLFLRKLSSYNSYVYNFNWIVAITLIFSTFLTSAGIDKVIFMFNAELFPTKFRNVGTGIGLVVYTICGAVVSKSYLYLEGAATLSGAFLIFGTSCFVCCTTFYFILPETEGKTLQEIEEHYDRKTKFKKASNLDNAEDVKENSRE